MCGAGVQVPQSTVATMPTGANVGERRRVRLCAVRTWYLCRVRPRCAVASLAE